MSSLVTIGIPVYKRLHYLPNVLGIVAAQDYPSIDLLVSDNGMNGSAVHALVEKHYSRPYRFRQNPATVSGSRHYTQLIENAAGEYCIILADDDEISPNYVSELVSLLERHPEASVALAMEETIDCSGRVLARSKETIPELMSGPDFIRATWGTRQSGLTGLCTFLAKTERLKACGGFPDIWAATSDEDLLIVKLVLDNFIAFSTRCSFRKRYYETSGGYAITLQDLARGIREFIACLDSDPLILDYAGLHASEWSDLRGYLVASAWNTYYFRWQGMYKNRISPLQWTMAGFALPGRYYKRVAMSVLGEALCHVEHHWPHAYAAYRAAKTRLRGNTNS